jgi:glutathione-regulated potassium-efflux system ancillary protein KefC
MCMGTCSTVAGSRRGRDPSLDLAARFYRIVRNRRRNDRSIDPRFGVRPGGARNGRTLGQVSRGDRRDRPDVSRRCRTRPEGLQAQVERGGHGRARQLLVPFSGMRGGGSLFVGMAGHADAGVAMSTTSVAVVYAVMLEFGFNTTEYGKTILAACFVTDLGTVVALGLIFAPFTVKTAIFLGAGMAAIVILPWATPRLFKLYGGRPSEFEPKFLIFCLLGMGAIATWAGSEAVLPAYLIGMVLAGTVGKDHALVRRLRTLTFGLLTPFYFIRAGSFVSIPALIAAPSAFVFFLIFKVATKIVGVYPVTKLFGAPNKEAMYTTLLMSTGLTLGTISSLFGLSHGIIDKSQYSALVAAVIGSAVIPTVIANAFYLPRHLLPKAEMEDIADRKQEPVTMLPQLVRRAE